MKARPRFEGDRMARITRLVRRRRRPQDEHGFVLVMAAIMISVLMVAAAFTVDLGLFYSRAAQLQRAADAGALAGVIYMPTNFSGARQAVLDVAKKNGIDPSAEPNVSMNVTPGATPRRLNVSITDSNVSTIFGKLVADHASITRSSVGEYVQQIPLGSAFNALGTGTLPGHLPSDVPSLTQNFWLGVGGYCLAKEDGDQRLSAYDGTRDPAGDYTCGAQAGTNAPVENLDYADTGYDYVVNVPCSSGLVGSPCASNDFTSQNIAIQVYDPTYWLGVTPNSRPSGIDLTPLLATHPQYNSTEVSTTFTVFGVDNTPLDYSDDAPVSASTFGTCPAATGCSAGIPDTDNNALSAGSTDNWVTLYTIPAGSRRGRYRVRVATEANQANSFGTNGFALRAALGGSFSICDSRSTGVAYNANCPGVSGDTAMSIFVDDPTNTSSEFFLARF